MYSVGIEVEERFIGIIQVIGNFIVICIINMVYYCKIIFIVIGKIIWCNIIYYSVIFVGISSCCYIFWVFLIWRCMEVIDNYFYIIVGSIF